MLKNMKVLSYESAFVPCKRMAAIYMFTCTLLLRLLLLLLLLILPPLLLLTPPPPLLLQVVVVVVVVMVVVLVVLSVEVVIVLLLALTVPATAVYFKMFTCSGNLNVPNHQMLFLSAQCSHFFTSMCLFS
jgi:hypothetical protein